MKTNCKGQSTIDRETMRSCSEQPPAVMTKAVNGLRSKIIRSLCHSILLPALSGVHRNSISGLKSNQSSVSQTSAKNTQRRNAEGKTKSSRGLLKLMEITAGSVEQATRGAGDLSRIGDSSFGDED